ncbi:MAG: hypothetical protein V7L27_05700 [Nostoc sp.]|uniref:hypothetical protein n=1 Tax=Nostoc sp. TaxID=1180 RepID=UPI002FFBFF77
MTEEVLLFDSLYLFQQEILSQMKFDCNFMLTSQEIISQKFIIYFFELNGLVQNPCLMPTIIIYADPYLVICDRF